MLPVHWPAAVPMRASEASEARERGNERDTHVYVLELLTSHRLESNNFTLRCIRTLRCTHTLRCICTLYGVRTFYGVYAQSTLYMHTPRCIRNLYGVYAHSKVYMHSTVYTQPSRCTHTLRCIHAVRCIRTLQCIHGVEHNRLRTLYMTVCKQIITKKWKSGKRH